MFNNSAQNLAQNTQLYQSRANTQPMGQFGQPQSYFQPYPPNFYQQNTFQNQQQVGQFQQRQLQEHLHGQQIQRTVGKVFQLFKSQDLSNFIMMTDMTLDYTGSLMKRASKEGESISKQLIRKEVTEAIRNKYLQIKERNLQILKAILNLRKQLITRMYMNKVTIPAKEVQLQKITEKICVTSAHIKQKLAHYKFNRQMNSHISKKVVKVEPINMPLVELKAASEKLCVQTIKAKEQLRICVQMLNQLDFV